MYMYIYIYNKQLICTYVWKWTHLNIKHQFLWGNSSLVMRLELPTRGDPPSGQTGPTIQHVSQNIITLYTPKLFNGFVHCVGPPSSFSTFVSPTGVPCDYKKNFYTLHMPCVINNVIFYKKTLARLIQNPRLSGLILYVWCARNPQQGRPLHINKKGPQPFWTPFIRKCCKICRASHVPLLANVLHGVRWVMSKPH